MGDKPVEYTVETVPCDPVYTRYTDGGGVKNFLFLFASRELYSDDIHRNIANSGFYEEFEDWIKIQNDSGILPDLGEKRTPVSLEVLTRGYALSADSNSARYQIQLKLLYEEG